MNFETSYKTIHFFPNTANKKQYIMLHHTGSAASGLSQAKYLCSNTRQVSCHYVVGQDTIYQLADDDKCTRHAGTGSYNGITNEMNMYAIGIEVCSDGANYTIKQLQLLNNLVKYLMDRHNIDVDNVIRHKDYAPSRKRDIGDNFYITQGFDSYTNRKRSLIAKKEITKEELRLSVSAQNILSALWEHCDDDTKESIATSAKKIREDFKNQTMTTKDGKVALAVIASASYFKDKVDTDTYNHLIEFTKWIKGMLK